MKNEFLYHATLKYLLPSIKKYGLSDDKFIHIGDIENPCPNGFIFMSSTPEKAKSFIPNADNGVIVLKIDVSALDQSKLRKIKNSDGYGYSERIPVSAITF